MSSLHSHGPSSKERPRFKKPAEQGTSDAGHESYKAGLLASRLWRL